MTISQHTRSEKQFLTYMDLRQILVVHGLIYMFCKAASSGLHILVLLVESIWMKNKALSIIILLYIEEQAHVAMFTKGGHRWSLKGGKLRRCKTSSVLVTLCSSKQDPASCFSSRNLS